MDTNQTGAPTQEIANADPNAGITPRTSPMNEAADDGYEETYKALTDQFNQQEQNEQKQWNEKLIATQEGSVLENQEKPGEKPQESNLGEKKETSEGNQGEELTEEEQRNLDALKKLTGEEPGEQPGEEVKEPEEGNPHVVKLDNGNEFEFSYEDLQQYAKKGIQAEDERANWEAQQSEQSAEFDRLTKDFETKIEENQSMINFGERFHPVFMRLKDLPEDSWPQSFQELLALDEEVHAYENTPAYQNALKAEERLSKQLADIQKDKKAETLADEWDKGANEINEEWAPICKDLRFRFSMEKVKEAWFKNGGDPVNHFTRIYGKALASRIQARNAKLQSMAKANSKKRITKPSETPTGYPGSSSNSRYVNDHEMSNYERTELELLQQFGGNT